MGKLLNVIKSNVLLEVTEKKVTCDKCSHSWGIEKNDNNPYLCHKCNYDNNKKEFLDEKWSDEYKKTINCDNPKGFSQKAHCQGKKKRKLTEGQSKKTIWPRELKFKKIKELINSQYPKCGGNPNKSEGCLGKIQNDECQTDEGIIYGPYSEFELGLSDSYWSVVNRFDTNSYVHKEILRIYEEDPQNDKPFKEWLYDNAKNLFNGEHTKRLVALNTATISKGYKLESYAKSIIEKEFKPERIKQHCAGDIRDRNLGQDFDVTINGVSHYFQIKSISFGTKIKKVTSEADSYYEIPSYHNSSKYDEKNVDVIMYLNDETKEYIMFHNDHQKISTIPRKVFTGPEYLIRYYEEPLRKKMDLEVENLGPRKSKKEFISDKTELIKYYDEKIKQFQDLKDKILQTESVKENYKNWLNKLNL